MFHIDCLDVEINQLVSPVPSAYCDVNSRIVVADCELFTTECSCCDCFGAAAGSGFGTCGILTTWPNKENIFSVNDTDTRFFTLTG